MGETRIRPCTARDLDPVMEIWEEASRRGHPFLTESFIAAEREMVRDIHLPAAETWVFEEDGRVLGFLSLVENEVGALFVDPGSHRRGVGRALMDHAKGRHTTLELDVFEENVSARAFYVRCGFVGIGVRPHAETGRPMLRMRYEAGPVR